MEFNNLKPKGLLTPTQSTIGENNIDIYLLRSSKFNGPMEHFKVDTLLDLLLLLEEEQDMEDGIHIRIDRNNKGFSLVGFIRDELNKKE